MFSKKQPRKLDIWTTRDTNSKQITAFDITDWRADKDGNPVAADRQRPAIATFPVSGAANEADQARRAEALLKYLQKEQTVRAAVQALDV